MVILRNLHPSSLANLLLQSSRERLSSAEAEKDNATVTPFPAREEQILTKRHLNRPASPDQP